MKKFLMIAAFMVAALGANAQNEVGVITLQPKVGMNLSTITGDGDQKMKFGLVAGAEAEYGISENFGIDFGVLYSMEGCRFKADGADKSLFWNLDYINIPILAQFYPTKGLALKAGVQPGFNVRHKASYDGNSANMDGVNSFNFSIPVGLSYEISSFVIDARYNIGITKIFKDADQGRNSTISLTVGYKFAL
jgi:hypothetical protein